MMMNDDLEYVKWDLRAVGIEELAAVYIEV